MMTIQQKTRLNYLLGRFEGLACAVSDVDVQTGLFDTCEWLQEFIDEDSMCEVKP